MKTLNKPLTRKQRKALKQRAANPPKPGVCSYKRNRQREIGIVYTDAGGSCVLVPVDTHGDR